jgi:hypothetical protein
LISTSFEFSNVNVVKFTSFELSVHIRYLELSILYVFFFYRNALFQILDMCDQIHIAIQKLLFRILIGGTFLSNQNMQSPRESTQGENESEFNQKYRTIQREPANPLYGAILRLVGVILFFLLFISTFQITFFFFHPILNTFTFAFLLIDGILKARQMMSSPNEKLIILEQHKTVQIISLILTTISIFVAIFHKYLNNQSHFTSWHSRFGLLAYFLQILNTSFGLFMIYTRKSYKDIHSKIAHGVIYFGLYTIVLGLFTEYIYSQMFKFVTGMCILCVGIIAIGVIWPSVTFKKE